MFRPLHESTLLIVRCQDTEYAQSRGGKVAPPFQHDFAYTVCIYGYNRSAINPVQCLHLASCTQHQCMLSMSSTHIRSWLLVCCKPQRQFHNTQRFQHLFAATAYLLTRRPSLILGKGAIPQILHSPSADCQSACRYTENAGYQANQDTRQAGAGSPGGPAGCPACRHQRRTPLCSWPHSGGFCWRGPRQSSPGSPSHALLCCILTPVLHIVSCDCALAQPDIHGQRKLFCLFKELPCVE